MLKLVALNVMIPSVVWWYFFMDSNTTICLFYIALSFDNIQYMSLFILFNSISMDLVLFFDAMLYYLIIISGTGININYSCHLLIWVLVYS